MCKKKKIKLNFFVGETVGVVLGALIAGIIVGSAGLVLVNYLISKKSSNGPILKMSGLINPNYKE